MDTTQASGATRSAFHTTIHTRKGVHKSTEHGTPSNKGRSTGNWAAEYWERSEIVRV